MSVLKRLAKSSYPLSCAAYMAHDWWTGRRLHAGRIETDSGRRHTELDLEASLAYIERVYSDYCRWGGVDHFEGTLGELGPGDNFGVALLALAGGARHVHAIDRYRSRRDPERQREIYGALSMKHGLDELFEGAPDEDSILGVSYHAGRPAEEFFRESGLRFDAILSRAVMEHLYDPLGALDDMLGALESGGLMIHRIDLRDHGMFEGRHPLTFLRIPEPVYRRMTRNSGRPNRVLLPDYRRWLDSRDDVDGEIRLSHLVGSDRELGPCLPLDVPQDEMERALARVAELRGHFARRFRDVSDEDLAVSGIVLVVRKR